MFACLFRRKEKIIERNEDDLEKECTICMDEIKDDGFVTKCQHRFHKNCLNEWISQYSNTECPICRKKLGLYVFETKKQRKQRIIKEEHMKQIQKEERELEEMARRIEEYFTLQIEREERERERQRYIKENRKRRKQFEDILEVLDIVPSRAVNLKKINFINCVSLKEFVKQYTEQPSGEERTGTCRFCKKNTYNRYQIGNGKIFHRECYKIYECHKHKH